MSEETKKEVQVEELNKSLDLLIDELFAEENEESVEKSMVKDMKQAKETADEAMAQVPKVESDEKNPGRPEQISDVPKVDEDGKRAGNYDADIAKKNEDAKKKEDDQVKPTPEMVKKAVISDEEYKEYQALKKAKEEAEKEEVLKKAKSEQMDLIKSAVIEATSEIRKENEELKKSLSEQIELIKSMANKPQKAKAITNLNAVEKFQKSGSTNNFFSKKDVLDIAEELVKSQKLSMENVIELENSGYIYDEEARRVLEAEIKKRS